MTFLAVLPDRIDEPVTSIPTANTTSPIPSTAGITSGRLMTRTAMSISAPKTNAGPHRTSSCSRSRSSNVRRWGSTPEAT